MRNLLIVMFALAFLVGAGAQEALPLRADGSITLWTVAGPLPNGPIMDHGKQCVGFYKDYLEEIGGESGANPAEGDSIALEAGGSIAWLRAFSEPSGLLNFNRTFNIATEAPAVAYAYCRLVSDGDQPVVLKIRSNDGVRVWLNENLVHENHVGRTIDATEDSVAVTLKQGDNRLLVKVDQSGGGWGLLLRAVGTDSKAAPGLRTSVTLNTPLAGSLVAASIQGTPFVRKTSEGDRQVLVAQITSGGIDQLTCRLESSDGTVVADANLGALPPGEHRVELAVPVLTRESRLRATFHADAAELVLADVVVAPPRPWQINLVQHVHTDIGYTRPQTEILPEHLRYIDYALDYCDLTDGYPDDAKFRWTCEITWAVKEYLKRRPPEQIERLRQRIAEGRIEVAGMFLNMSEIATESSMAASLMPIREIREVLGAPVTLAMQNDVNGAAWCLADFFPSIGVKYLSMGINETRSILPFDRPTPFWWESPSGNRVLAFRADHYHTGNMWRIHAGDAAPFESGLQAYLERLEKLDYPFDLASVQYSGYHTDNSPPAMKECDLIRDWNERYTWPRLRSATASEYLKAIEAQHGDELPVHRQAWPDWWTDGFGSAARETAASRQTHSAMQANETLMAMAALMGIPPAPDAASRAQSVQNALLFYDEHTFGAAESISDPMVENSMVQWGEKGSYAWDAVKQAGLLREEALGALQAILPRVEVPTIAVFNTLNWTRSGLVEVFIDEEILPRDRRFHIVDPENGRAIPAQPMRSRSEGSYWALWASNVPPLGYKSYRIEVLEEHASAPAPVADVGGVGGVLENSFYRLEVDPATGGLLRLLDKQGNRELADGAAPWRMGQLLRETLNDRGAVTVDTIQRKAMADVKLLPVAAGPLWQSIAFEGELEGCEAGRGVRGEIRLYETEPRIEFHFALRKLPLTTPEAIYVAFPFSSPESEIVYEGQGGLVHPGAGQIPGSASDWQTVQGFAAVRGGDGQIILGSDAVPLVQLGDLNLGKWQPITTIPKPHVYSWVMNNYWFTNFRATQEGEFKWSYYLTSTRDAGNTAATQFGWGSRIPLIARVLASGNTGARPTVLSALDLGLPNLALISARPAHYGGGIVLHIRELEGLATELPAAKLLAGPGAASLDEINLLEEIVQPNPASVSFAPFEPKFVRIRLK